MNLFVKRLLLFLGVFFIVLFVIFSRINYLIDEHNRELKIERNVESVFFGDSHIEMAINDSLTLNSMNFGLQSESYYFTYYKIRFLLKHKHSVRKIYVGFSYHNLSSYYDDYVSGKDSKDVTPKYFFILPFFEKVRILFYNFGTMENYLLNIQKKNYK